MIKVSTTFNAKAWAAKVKKQATFATATAINATAKVVQAESGKALERERSKARRISYPFMQKAFNASSNSALNAFVREMTKQVAKLDRIK
jgi:hypothetical protein